MEPKLPIYLDNASTTIIDSRVAKAIYDNMIGSNLGNPSSNTHIYGWNAQKALENARYRVSKIINARSRELIFTSGATESNNIAIQGILAPYLNGNDDVHAITSLIEHKAVLDTFKFMETLGVKVTYLSPNENGVISSEMLKRHIQPTTKLVSLMHVNNETGTINDIKSLGELCRKSKILFHVDAAQSVGKLFIDVNKFNIDLLSMSGHKIYCPKGIGALYFSRHARLRLRGIYYGGSQERGLRPGTQSTQLIEGLATALDIASVEMTANYEHVTLLRRVFINTLIDLGVPILINGGRHSSPYIINIHLPNIDTEELLMRLKSVALSTGSACNSKEQSNSHVLSTLFPSRLSQGANIRISFCAQQSLLDVIEASKHIAFEYKKTA